MPAIAAVSDVRNAPDPDVDDRRDERARGQRGERDTRNCWQSTDQNTLVIVLPEHRHGADREDRDQRHEQSVLEEVLAVLGASEAARRRAVSTSSLRLAIASGSSPRKNCDEASGASHRRTPRLLDRCLRGAAERTGDRGEDAVDRSARRTHRTDRDERDQRDEQRVLEQVLALFVAANDFTKATS